MSLTDERRCTILAQGIHRESLIYPTLEFSFNEHTARTWVSIYFTPVPTSYGVRSFTIFVLSMVTSGNHTTVNVLGVESDHGSEA